MIVRLSQLIQQPKRLAASLAHARRPLKDAAADNAARWALADALKATGLPEALASGGRTKFNRTTLGVSKTHALDAACVGEMPAVMDWQKPTLSAKCSGRGCYQRTRLDSFGFPRGYLMCQKQVHGFQTGVRRPLGRCRDKRGAAFESYCRRILFFV